MKSLVVASLAAVSYAAAPYCLPGQPCFPSASELSTFNTTVNGRLIKTVPPAAPCYEAAYNAEVCKAVTAKSTDFDWRASQPAGMMYTNFETGNTTENPGCPVPAATQEGPLEGECTLGQMASYVVKASTADEISKAVKFAAKYNLRLRIKNSGHDYTGRSTGEGAFTIWTRNMDDAKLIRAFKPCDTSESSDVVSAGPGVSVEQLYAFAGQNGVLTIGGYTESIGAAGGYVLGGGTGPFGAVLGLAVDNVLQYDIITADGEQKIANECKNPELFWANRGGGGTFGVVTRVYFKAYPALPAVNMFFGLVTCEDDKSYSNLISEMVDLQVSTRDAGQLGIWSANKGKRTVTLISLHPFFNSTDIGDPQDAQRLFSPILNIPSCNATQNMAQFTGPSSWNDAYQTFVLPIIQAGAPVGKNIANISRLISYALVGSKDGLSKIKDYILNLPPQLSFLWQNSVGQAARGLPVDATAVHPDWRDTFAFINAPVGGPSNGTVTAAQMRDYEIVLRASDETFGKTPYYNEEWGVNLDNWQERFWGSNYERLLRIKKEVDPRSVFNCVRCVGSEGGL